ncbi:MAG: glucoamylase family protein [Gemmatimonadota bacterium]
MTLGTAGAETTPDRLERLLDLQRATFGYFWELTDPSTGLVPDNTRRGAPCSIAAVGLGLTSLTVGVERGYLARSEAAERTRRTLRTFWSGPHGDDLEAISHRGFFYHFLDMTTGARTWRSELSTIDTAILLTGALSVGTYFDRSDPVESKIRELADALYRRADWHWALDGGEAVSHGWKPESGFLRPRWTGYNEGLLLCVLGLGSPSYALPSESWSAWTSSYRWKRIYGLDYLYAGPLFIHQLPHSWLDLRGIRDDFMRERGTDYFENSRRATFIQQRYGIRNPREYHGYGEWTWGVTASDGPGPAVKTVNGTRRRFYDYAARGVPFGPDDGTLAPWAVVASLPFAPEIVLPTIEWIDERYPEMTSTYGFKCSFNPTFSKGRQGWISKGYYGLDQGPIVLMIENHLTGFVWELMRRCPYIVTGLERAGFRGGWLSA